MNTDQDATAVLLRQGCYRECLKIYAKRLKNDRNQINLANVAGCLYKLAKLKAARSLALESLGENRDSCPQASLVLANIEFDLNNNFAAWKLYKALTETPLREQGWLGLATICARRSKNKLAEKIFLSLEAADPGNALYCKSLCLHYIKVGRHKYAWPNIIRWLELSPDSTEAWETAYLCAKQLKEESTAKLAAEKLVEISPQEPRYLEWLGVSLSMICEVPEAVAKIYEKASSLSPHNLAYYINASIACDRVAPRGSYAHSIAKKLTDCSNQITQSLNSGKAWLANGDYPLLNSSFFVSYSPINLKKIYGPYFQSLSAAFGPFINQSLQQSHVVQAEYRKYFERIDSARQQLAADAGNNPIRIGFISRNFFEHSNSQAFAGMIKYLDRSHFSVVLIHMHPARPDWVQSWLNAQADEVVYLSDSIGHAHASLCRLELDVLFFTDLGMDAWDFFLPEMRACPLQVTGWGLPHTSGFRSIDYYFSSSLLEEPRHQDEYIEKHVLLDGLPCCFPSELLAYQKLSRDYFFLPNNQLVIGCVQVLPKVHPDLDLLIEEISKLVPDAYFAFMCDKQDNVTARFLDRLAKRAPTASQRILMLERCFSKDFLALCDCFDFMLDTPYYGAGITSYLSIYVGTPVVCFQGARLRDSTTAAIYKYLEIKNAPVASSMHEYIELSAQLAKNSNLRLQIKKATVASASKLYDQQDYVRSLEKFLLEIVRPSENDEHQEQGDH